MSGCVAASRCGWLAGLLFELRDAGWCSRGALRARGQSHACARARSPIPLAIGRGETIGDIAAATTFETVCLSVTFYLARPFVFPLAHFAPPFFWTTHGTASTEVARTSPAPPPRPHTHTKHAIYPDSVIFSVLTSTRGRFLVAAPFRPSAAAPARASSITSRKR